MAYSINQQTSYFLKTKGITAKDLTSHPLIDDLILLVSVRDEFANEFNQTQQEYLTNLWHYVYNNQYRLKTKHLKKLEQFTITLESQRQARKHKQAIIQGKIKRLKMKGSENPATHKQNEEGYNDTNASSATNSAYKLLD